MGTCTAPDTHPPPPVPSVQALGPVRSAYGWPVQVGHDTGQCCLPRGGKQRSAPVTPVLTLAGGTESNIGRLQYGGQWGSDESATPPPGLPAYHRVHGCDLRRRTRSLTRRHWFCVVQVLFPFGTPMGGRARWLRTFALIVFAGLVHAVLLGAGRASGPTLATPAPPGGHRLPCPQPYPAIQVSYRSWIFAAFHDTHELI